MGLERKSLTDILAAPALAFDKADAPISSLEKDSGRLQTARRFLSDELTDLRALADLLSNGEAAASRDKNISLDEQIKRELTGREYLYLHFPDGTEPTLDRAFLTRVRAQIDFFAKDIESALAFARS